MCHEYADTAREAWRTLVSTGRLTEARSQCNEVFLSLFERWGRLGEDDRVGRPHVADECRRLGMSQSEAETVGRRMGELEKMEIAAFAGTRLHDTRNVKSFLPTCRLDIVPISLPTHRFYLVQLNGRVMPTISGPYYDVHERLTEVNRRIRGGISSANLFVLNIKRGRNPTADPLRGFRPARDG